MKHTPGPWFANQLSIYAKANCIVNGGRFVAMCATDTPLARQTAQSVDAEALANARLMAAAPELLAALEAALTVLSDSVGAFDYEAACAAIAKVRGPDA